MITKSIWWMLAYCFSGKTAYGNHVRVALPARIWFVLIDESSILVKEKIYSLGIGYILRIYWMFYILILKIIPCYHDIQSNHFMANRWGNNGNSEKLYFLGSKITADGDCSHEIKRWLLLGRKAMITVDSILKSRNITLPTKIHLVKGMVFLVVMHGCKSWTIKKAECWRIDAFELWCWRRLLRVPWTARRSNQSILKEISPGC